MPDTAHALALYCVAPVALGGIVLRARAGESRDACLRLLERLLPPGTPLRKVPLQAGTEALLGGLDLSPSLRAGRPVSRPGLLAQADGGVVVLGMAERIPGGTAALIAQVLDTGHVTSPDPAGSDNAPTPTRFGVVALDEGLEDESMPASLRDRLGIRIELDALTVGLRAALAATGADDGPGSFGAGWTAADVLAARERFPRVTVDEKMLEAVCATAAALGIETLRAPLLALAAARAVAALDGRDAVSADDAALAASLVLAPRATRMPVAEDPSAPRNDGSAQAEGPEPPPDAPRDQKADAAPEAEPATETEPEVPGDSRADPPRTDPGDPDQPLEARVLDAAVAAIPARLLSSLLGEAGRGRSAATSGKSGELRRNGQRGRPAGVRPGRLRSAGRINLTETLRAAAPWQTLRRREAGRSPGRPASAVLVQPQDLRFTRFKQRTETTTIFVVDASGSSALHRLAEAKGAVELLLADCYVRRDQVAVVAFRGKAAEALLPPTRSLARAKRSLAGLPGGGGTPLAAGLDAAIVLAGAVVRRGATPLIVLLTDGRANIGRDGRPGRDQAAADALDAANQVREAGITALLIDTSPQPQPGALALAVAMRARYLPLPHAGAADLSRAVRELATG